MLTTRDLVQQTGSAVHGQDLFSRFGRELSTYERLDRRVRRSLAH